MSRRYRDQAWPLTAAAIGGTARRDGPAGWFEEGYVLTELFAVGFFRMAGRTRLTASFNGVEYSRTYDRDFKYVGLIRIATRFARDVVAGKFDAKRRGAR